MVLILGCEHASSKTTHCCQLRVFLHLHVLRALKGFRGQYSCIAPTDRGPFLLNPIASSRGKHRRKPLQIVAATGSSYSDGSASEDDSVASSPLVRVRLSVHYRVHKRQMLFIGGSEMPFGWSFLSIARVPMIWGPGDIWTAEVDLRAGARVEYKYVILEEQDWTKQENIDSEGKVTFSYRTEPDDPPDYQTIQKKMAIVAWQPGPNRVMTVPSEEELLSIKPGEVRTRELPKLKRWDSSKLPLWPFALATQQADAVVPAEPEGVQGAQEWEALSLVPDGSPLFERRDLWAASDRHPPRIRLQLGP